MKLPITGNISIKILLWKQDETVHIYMFGCLIHTLTMYMCVGIYCGCFNCRSFWSLKLFRGSCLCGQGLLISSFSYSAIYCKMYVSIDHDSKLIMQIMILTSVCDKRWQEKDEVPLFTDCINLLLDYCLYILNLIKFKQGFLIEHYLKP